MQQVRRIFCALAALCFIAAGLAAERARAEDPPRCFGSPFLESVCPHSNFEGAIPHADWESEAADKLSTFDKGAGGGSKPNILVIYVDDMGWGDPGVYGGGTALGAPTPNIDALAARGLRMTSAYSQPACTPTRAAWQTGRLPQRTGLTRPTAAGEANAGMAGETTIAQILRDQGYRTGMTGKWHLGEAEGTWPTDVGYDEYYGNLSVNTAYHDWRDKHFSPELVFDSARTAAIDELLEIKTTVHSYADATSGVTDPSRTRAPDEIDLDCNDVDAGTASAFDGVTVENNSCEQNLEQQYLDWTKKFMARAAAADEPFFVYHAMNKVHTLNHPSTDYEGLSPAATPFRDGMVEIDDVVGALVAAVDALDSRHGTETFIFFTSDNGAEEDVHAGGINTSDSGHHPWRGAKGTTWEGGVRVSAIATWDGMIQAGRVSDGLFDHMDLFNTLARLGGVDDLPARVVQQVRPTVLRNPYIDGIDQTSWLLAEQPAWDPSNPLPDLDDPQQTSNREAIYYWYGQEFYGVRWAEYKRMERIMTIGMNTGPQTYGGLFNATKSETSDPSMGWYFNLYADPKERMPITRTWNISTLAELSTHSKMTFVDFPQAPRGVRLNGYILGGPAGGTVSLKALRKLIRDSAIQHSALPD